MIDETYLKDQDLLLMPHVVLLEDGALLEVELQPLLQLLLGVIKPLHFGRQSLYLVLLHLQFRLQLSGVSAPLQTLQGLHLLLQVLVFLFLVGFGLLKLLLQFPHLDVVFLQFNGLAGQVRLHLGNFIFDGGLLHHNGPARVEMPLQGLDL